MDAGFSRYPGRFSREWGVEWYHDDKAPLFYQRKGLLVIPLSCRCLHRGGGCGMRSGGGGSKLSGPATDSVSHCHQGTIPVPWSISLGEGRSTLLRSSTGVYPQFLWFGGFVLVTPFVFGNGVV